MMEPRPPLLTASWTPVPLRGSRWESWPDGVPLTLFDDPVLGPPSFYACYLPAAMPFDRAYLEGRPSLASLEGFWFSDWRAQTVAADLDAMYGTLGDVSATVIRQDSRATRARSKERRHRFAELVTAVEPTLGVYRSSVRPPLPPTLIAEIRAHSFLLRFGAHQAAWPEMRAGSVIASGYVHTITTLLMAEMLTRSGSTVSLLAASAVGGPVADIAATIDGSPVDVEVKCPEAFRACRVGSPPRDSHLSNREVAELVTTVRKRARRQLATRGSSLLIIGGHDVTIRDVSRIQAAAAQLLRDGGMRWPHLVGVGVSILNVGVRLPSVEQTWSARAMPIFNLQPNPHYSGPVDGLRDQPKSPEWPPEPAETPTVG